METERFMQQMEKLLTLVLRFYLLFIVLVLQGLILYQSHQQDILTKAMGELIDSDRQLQQADSKLKAACQEAGHLAMVERHE